METEENPIPTIAHNGASFTSHTVFSWREGTGTMYRCGTLGTFDEALTLAHQVDNEADDVTAVYVARKELGEKLELLSVMRGDGMLTIAEDFWASYWGLG